MKKYLLFIVWLILLAIYLMGCGATYHISRAEHHLNKAREKGAVILRDTVYVKRVDTIERVAVDTVVSVKHDTVRIEKERLKLQYIRVNDSVYINAECDTVILVRKVPVTVTDTVFKEVVPGWVKWLKWGLIVGGVLGVAMVVRKVIPF